MSFNQGMNDPDLQYAIVLQKQFDLEDHNGFGDDTLLASQLQEEFNKEIKLETGMGLSYDTNYKKPPKSDGKCLVDPSWELVDPTPNIHNLFVVFNARFFENKLVTVCVSWSKRMTKCAGICSYQGRGGMCSITLSEPLLKLRPRKDLVETLLHEMIHAYLFVTNNNRDRDGHGPEFHKHMYRINNEAGTNITVYHDFHDEVRLYQQHWWRCNGLCQTRRPFFGMVRRSINRAPGPNDRWWAEHQRTCGGTFLKVREPEKKKPPSRQRPVPSSVSNGDIRKYITSPTKNNPPNSPKRSSNNSKPVYSPNHDIRSFFPKKSSSLSDTENKTIGIINNRNGNSPEITAVFNNGNIHGFKNLGTNKSSNVRKNLKDTEFNKSNKGFTATKSNNSNTVVITSKQSTHNLPKLVENNFEKPPLFPGAGKVLSSNTNTLDYNKVRDHWLKKYDNSNISNKRQASDDINETTPKKKHQTPKVDTSQNNIADKSNLITCPICDMKLLASVADEHVDKCLNEQYDENKIEQQEQTCCVCNKKVPKSVYNEHLSNCFNNSVQDDEVFERLVECPICGTFLDNSVIENHVVECIEKNSEVKQNKDSPPNDHLKQCDVCSEFINSNHYNLHLEQCLHKMLDNIEEKYDIPSSNEKVNCLVCKKEVFKSDLNVHLDECMSDVFDDKYPDGIPKDEEKPSCSKDCNGDVENTYNCPFCMDLYSELDMSSHLTECLQSEKSSEEKAILIESFSSDDF